MCWNNFYAGIFALKQNLTTEKHPVIIFFREISEQQLFDKDKASSTHSI